MLNDLRDGEKGSIFVALIFKLHNLQTFVIFFVFFKGWFVKIGLFSDSHNFGLVSGKVIYDIVLDALIRLVFVGKRRQVLC